jgi:hypothetical protein
VTLYAELRVEFQNEFTSFRNSGEGAGLACFSMLPEFVLDYWQFTTHYSLCFAYAKRPLIFVLLTGTSSVRFCFGFIQQKSLLICPANSLKFEQTFFVLLGAHFTLAKIRVLDYCFTLRSHSLRLRYRSFCFGLGRAGFELSSHRRTTQNPLITYAKRHVVAVTVVLAPRTVVRADVAFYCDRSTKLRTRPEVAGKRNSC